ncbi:MAG TPA: non-canonical purine NTP pyrophosphatase [Candidatus Saccharimonadales bacterium]|nr:non-canonical purine NTP pyrophosphatase [Candidatus Saccharimonadales bacterium]
MRRLLYATTNDYKLSAANMALKDYGITLEKLGDGSLDVPEIQSDNQEEVAIDKAEKYFRLLRRPLVVMDFGFFVEGLGGFPGVYTKYSIDTIGAKGMSALVCNLDNRTAYTKRTVVFKDNNVVKVFSYSCPGTMLAEERGTNGRDFDRLFLVEETGKTLAEMNETEKAAASGYAWHQLGEWLPFG